MIALWLIHCQLGGSFGLMKGMNQTRYAVVAKDLMEGISSGRFPVGTLLPTELELCELYDVSRHTVRAAITQLQNQGLVSRRKRVGTRVESATPKGGYSQSLASVSDLVHLAETQVRSIQSVQHFVADIALAKRLGLDWNYEHPKEVFAELTQVMDSISGITWDRLEREDAVVYPCTSPDDPGQPLIFTDGFPTSSGRGKFVPASLISPDEIPDTDYPTVLTTGRLLEHWHTGAMTRRAKALEAQEPEAVVAMHPKDIGRMGFTRGQKVTVETRRGGVTLTLRADRDVTPGMLFMPFCYTEAPANFLTNPQLDPYGKIPEFKFSAARITSA